MSAERPTRRTFLATTMSAAVGVVVPARASAAVDRSMAQRYRFPTPNSNIDTGGAIIAVNGSMSAVNQVVTDYRRYVDILPRLSQSKVMGRRGKSVDVYLRAPIMSGVNHVWGVTRLTSYPWGTRGKKIVGRYVKGNLDGFHAQWKMYPCGTKRTVIRLELFLDPQVPVPADVITRELEWASDKAVTAVRDMVECNRSTVKND